MEQGAIALTSLRERGADGQPLEDSAKLCRTCRNFDLYSFYRDPFGFRGYMYSSAVEAANRNCSFCAFMVDCFEDGVRQRNRPMTDEKWRDNLWIHLDLRSHASRVDVVTGTSSLMVAGIRAFLAPENHTLPRVYFSLRTPKPIVTLNFHVLADRDTPASQSEDVVGRYPGEDAESDDYTGIITTWLRDCQQSHPRCKLSWSGSQLISTGESKLPTRCIEVHPGGFRLQETAGQRGSYIALSHRWTTDTEISRTTTTNLGTRLQELPEILPYVFLDTFYLARRLGVRYVWVDSLCIIQEGDDGEDWRREAVRMSDYYQGALMTVVASSASPEHGLFPPKITPTPRLARLPYRNRAGQREGFFYVSSYNLDMDQQYQQQVQRSELLTRGWVFQEWLLSQRIVYFTPSGMFMECQSKAPQNERGEGTELWQDEIPSADPTNPGSIPPSREKQQSQKMSYALITTAAEGYSNLWFDIAEAYSTLALTKAEDRVIALAGVAKEFRGALEAVKPNPRQSGPSSEAIQKQGLAYLSGIWLRDIHHSLLWQQNPPFTKHCNPPARVSGFPTWSWTSVPCPVTWERTDPAVRVRQEARVLAVVNNKGVRFVCHVDSPSAQTPANAATAPARLRLTNPSQRAFDIDTKFAALRIRAPLLWVVAREQLSRATGDPSVQILHELSGCKETQGPWNQRNFWRNICSMERDDEICGWGSFEHPEYHGENLGQEVLALLVSTRLVTGRGYSLGCIMPWHTVYSVLFVRGVEGLACYERIGVGRLFGKEVDRGYRRAAWREMELV